MFDESADVSDGGAGLLWWLVKFVQCDACWLEGIQPVQQGLVIRRGSWHIRVLIW